MLLLLSSQIRCLLRWVLVSYVSMIIVDKPNHLSSDTFQPGIARVVSWVNFGELGCSEKTDGLVEVGHYSRHW